MSSTDRTITLAAFLKWETPGGNVLLCDGGILAFDGEQYSAQHSVFGSVQDFDAIESGFGDTAEGGDLVLAPNVNAAQADWWRDDLFDTRMRLWLGEIGPDGVAVTSATLLADWIVDSVERTQAAGGQDLLTITLMARTEKLFLAQEGNVCSARFHKSVWPGENGFNNCTDLVGFVAWGAASPPRSGADSYGPADQPWRGLGVRR